MNIEWVLFMILQLRNGLLIELPVQGSSFFVMKEAKRKRVLKGHLGQVKDDHFYHNSGFTTMNHNMASKRNK